MRKFVPAVVALALACFVVAKVDNVITEVRFAPVYAPWSAVSPSQTLTINQGDRILIRMNENPGTGYGWILVTDFDQTVCYPEQTSNLAVGIFEPSTSTSGSASKVVQGTARPYVPPGAGQWPYPYPWGDRRFDLRCNGTGSLTLKLRYKRSWETKYSWESDLFLTILPNM